MFLSAVIKKFWNFLNYEANKHTHTHTQTHYLHSYWLDRNTVSNFYVVSQVKGKVKIFIYIFDCTNTRGQLLKIIFAYTDNWVFSKITWTAGDTADFISVWGHISNWKGKLNRGRGLIFALLFSSHLQQTNSWRGVVKHILSKPSNWRHQRRHAIPEWKQIIRFWLKIAKTNAPVNWHNLSSLR